MRWISFMVKYSLYGLLYIVATMFPMFAYGQVGSVVFEKNSQVQSNAQQESLANNIGSTAPKKDIYLNFENTELLNFVNYMAELKQINLLPDKGLEGSKVSLTIRDPLSLEGAWKIFMTVLEMAGFSLIQAGDLYKVVAKDKKLTEPLPAYINVPLDSLPDSDQVIRYVLFLENVKVDAVSELYSSMLSDKHGLVAQPEVNGFVVTDKSYNIKSATKIIQELDQAGLPETVVVMHLKRTNAVDVKNLLNSLMKNQDTNPLARLLGKRVDETTEYFPPGTKIVAEERTNSLILLGAPGPIKKIENFVVNHIDTELRATASPLHIYELQHVDAEQVKEILEQATDTSGLSSASEQTARYGGVRGGVKYFKSMTFQADKAGNRLIVSSTDEEDWQLLKKTIQDLDKPQPQVAIEALVIAINDTDMKNLGGMMRNKKHGVLGKNIDFQSPSLTGYPILEMVDSSGNPTTDSTGTPVSLLGDLSSILNTIGKVGQTVLTFGAVNNIWALLQMVRQQSNATVLSQPFLSVMNKTEGTLTSGLTARVLVEQGSDQSGYEDVTANTTLIVTPQINLDGIINLKIEVTIDDLINIQTGERQKKSVKTFASVANGQVLALGGFVQTQINETRAKTPILADVPLLGWFFKNQNRMYTKNYVFIFMAPTILKPRQQPGMQMYTRMKLYQAANEIEGGINTLRTPDPIFNWFFDAGKENYSHKVVDFANARYQPTTVDIKHDSYYRSSVDTSDVIDRRIPPHQPGQIYDQEHVEQRSHDMVDPDGLGEKRKKLRDLVASRSSRSSQGAQA